MYSEQIKRIYKTAAERKQFTQLKVCRSNAGYYIGTHRAAWGTEPGSRDSIYFQSREEAEKQLARLEAGEIDYTNPIMRPYP